MAWLRGLHGILLARCTLPNVVRDYVDGRVCYGQNGIEVWAYDPDDSIYDVPTLVVGFLAYFNNPVLVRRLVALATSGVLSDDRVELPTNISFYVGQRLGATVRPPGMTIIEADDYTIYTIVSASLQGDDDIVEDTIENGIMTGRITRIVLVEYEYPYVPDFVVSRGYCVDTYRQLEQIKEWLRYGECEEHGLDIDKCDDLKYDLEMEFDQCIRDAAINLERQGVLAPQPAGVNALAVITRHGVTHGCDAYRLAYDLLPERESYFFRNACTQML